MTNDGEDGHPLAQTLRRGSVDCNVVFCEVRIELPRSSFLLLLLLQAHAIVLRFGEGDDLLNVGEHTPAVTVWFDADALDVEPTFVEPDDGPASPTPPETRQPPSEGTLDSLAAVW